MTIAAAAARGQEPTPPASRPSSAHAAAEALRGDLRLLARELPQRHKNLFFRLDRKSWDAGVAALDREIAAGISRSRFVAGLMRLVASVGDSHTAVGWTRAGLRVVPLHLFRFAEGVHVVAFPAAHPRLRRARLRSVAGRPLAEVIAALAPLVSHDNEVTLQAQVLSLLLVPALLRAVGVGDSDEHATFGFAGEDGEPFEITLQAMSPRAARGVRSASSFAKVPLFAEQGRRPYWFRYLVRGHALYLKYNRCTNFAGFRSLVRSMWDTAGGRPIDRLVVDLRDNGGGNSLVLEALFEQLERRPRLRGGRLFAIIGRRTFSSALLNAMALRRRFDATLVGEPTAGKPNHFGEIRPLPLPGSHLTVYYSTKLFRRVAGDPASLEPDVVLPLHALELFEGRDPFLAYCLRAPLGEAGKRREGR